MNYVSLSALIALCVEYGFDGYTNMPTRLR